MKLRVLVDNYTFIDKYYYGEPGICFYIEDGDKRILLDLGYSDIFIKNAGLMGIDISKVDTIVFSHGHDDHTRGLKYYFESHPNSRPNIFAHSKAFDKKFHGDLYIGSPFSRDELEGMCNLNIQDKPIKISDNIIYLGQIPRANDFEVNRSIGVREENGLLIEDNLIDDTALVYTGDDGIHIITGCSHSGICNIIEYAKMVTGLDKVVSVIGGFHLFKTGEMVARTIDYFKENNIENLYPCHCTSFNVRSKMNTEIGVKDVGVGLCLEWS